MRGLHLARGLPETAPHSVCGSPSTLPPGLLAHSSQPVSNSLHTTFHLPTTLPLPGIASSIPWGLDTYLFVLQKTDGASGGWKDPLILSLQLNNSPPAFLWTAFIPCITVPYVYFMCLFIFPTSLNSLMAFNSPIYLQSLGRCLEYNRWLKLTGAVPRLLRTSLAGRTVLVWWGFGGIGTLRISEAACLGVGQHFPVSGFGDVGCSVFFR